MEEQFNIKENGFDEIRKKTIVRTIPIILLAALGGLAMSHFRSDGEGLDMYTLAFTIPIVIGALAFGLNRGIKRQKDIFNSYTLIINEEKIIRKQNITPDIEIPLNEIKEITRTKEGAFAIKGENPKDLISIPSQIERINELELKLSGIVEITASNRKSLVQKFPWAIPLILIGLMMIVYVSTNKIIVGIAGLSLSIGMIYLLIVTQKSKHVDKKTKRSTWLILLVIFSVIGVTYFKVFGNN